MPERMNAAGRFCVRSEVAFRTLEVAKPRDRRDFTEDRRQRRSSQTRRDSGSCLAFETLSGTDSASRRLGARLSSVEVCANNEMRGRGEVPPPLPSRACPVLASPDRTRLGLFGPHDGQAARETQPAGRVPRAVMASPRRPPYYLGCAACRRPPGSQRRTHHGVTVGAARLVDRTRLGLFVAVACNFAPISHTSRDGHWPGSRRRRREALENVNVPSYVVDETGIVRWMNPAAEQLLGNIRGRHFTSVIAPEDRPRARERFAQKMLGTSVATDATGHLVSPPGRGCPWRSARWRSRTVRRLSASSG